MRRILFRDCTNDSWSCWTKKCSYFTNKISFSQTKLLAYLLFGSVIYSTRSLKGTYKFSMRIYNVRKTSELFTSSIIFYLKFHGSFRNAKVRSPFNYDSSEFKATMLYIARSISTTVLNILEISKPFMNLDVLMRNGFNASTCWGLLCKMESMEIRTEWKITQVSANLFRENLGEQLGY